MAKYDPIRNAAEGTLPLEQVDLGLLKGFLAAMKGLFSEEAQLITLPDKELVFVGDTHSDYQSSMKVVEKYLTKDRVLIFLGDYVDRAMEPYADIRNMLYLFHLKYTSKNVILLRGNHEDPFVNTLYGFRESVEGIWDEAMWKLFNEVFLQMPLAVVTDHLIALHGGLPEIDALSEIGRIPKGLIATEDKVLAQLLWNDSMNSSRRIIETDNRGMKDVVCYGTPFFEEIMTKLNRHILVRAHDYTVKGWSFDRRCLTLITSAIYAHFPERKVPIDEPLKGCLIAIVPPGCKSSKDIKVVDIYL